MACRPLHVTLMPSSMLLHSLLLAIICAVSFSVDVTPPKPPMRKKNGPNLLTYLSSDWILASELNEHQDFIRHTSTILEHLKKSEVTVQNLVPGAPGYNTNPDITPCNLGRSQSTIPWITFAKHAFLDRRWNISVDFPFLCNTEYAEDMPSVHQALDERSVILKRLAPKLSKKAGQEWPRATAISRQVVETGGRRCEVNVAGGLRRGDKWYALTRITNQDQIRPMSPRGRLYVVEYIRIEGNKFYVGDTEQSMQKSLRENETFIENATTGLERLGGKATASAYSVTEPAENPAVQDALGRSQLYTEQADDATTISNIAILALPLVLNLVPVGLVAEVSTKRMLGYAALSDVLTVLPMGIKGFELIFLGGRGVASVGTRITTNERGPEMHQMAVGEVWGVKCSPKRGVRTAGIAFVVTAIVFLFVGVIGEIWTWRWTRRKKRELLKQYLLWQKQTKGTLQKSVPDDGAEIFEEEYWTEFKEQ